MIGGIFGNQSYARNTRNTIRMGLERRIPEILRIVLLAREVADLGRHRIGRKRKRESHLGGRTVDAFCLALEVESIETADTGFLECCNVSRRAFAFQYQHRQSLAARQEVAREAAEREHARR